jgi:hypothetical protein
MPNYTPNKLTRGRTTKLGDYCTNCHEMITVHNMATKGFKLRAMCKPCLNAIDGPLSKIRKQRARERKRAARVGKITALIVEQK